MNAVLTALSASQTVAVALVGALVAIAGAVLTAALRARLHVKAIDRCVELVRRDHEHDARIHARRAGVAALLDALSDEPSARAANIQRSLIIDGLLLLICTGPIAGMMLFGHSTLSSPPEAHAVTTIAALLFSFAVLLPASLVGWVLICHMSARSHSRLRAGYTRILAHRTTVASSARLSLPPQEKS